MINDLEFIVQRLQFRCRQTYLRIPISEQIEDQEKTEDDNVNPEVIQSPKQEVQTNSTVLSKQIKIVSQLNAKQVDGLISDRNTIKAHGS